MNNGTRIIRALLAASIALAILAAPARADFGLLPGAEGFDASARDAAGNPVDLAGGHPHTITVDIGLNRDSGGVYSDGDLRSLRLDLPPGLVENSSVVGRCSATAFNTPRVSPFQETRSGESCPLGSQIGRVTVRSAFAGGETRTFGLFNLDPEPGTPARIGFNAYGSPVTFERHVELDNGEYRLALEAREIPRWLNISGLKVVFWGNPWLAGHDLERGNCLNEVDPENGFGVAAELATLPGEVPAHGYIWGTCSIGNPEFFPPYAYLSLPTSCSPAPAYAVTATAWGQPLAATRSQALPLQGCDLKSFATRFSVAAVSDRTSSGTGLDFALDVDQAGLYENITTTGRTIASVVAPSQVKEAVVQLPEGVAINPSVGAGLGACSPAQYAAETPTSAPGAGCPNESKIGTIDVQTPLFEAPLTGGIFLAAPRQNPFGTLLALYLVAKLPERGILVKVPVKVTADGGSGRFVASFENLPKLPYARFSARLREGQRALLGTPARCGSYPVGLELRPWIDPTASFLDTTAFQFGAGVGGGACPSGDPAFTPQASAGNLGRGAGSYAPFYLHLTRNDTEQEITSYSAILPKGLLGKIAGVPFCPEAAIAAAKANSGFAESARPSCPEASKIGHTTAGYGLGDTLAYAPGNLYLAGPYKGSPLSVVAIDSATVGPFDLGVIVVRSAVRVDPLTTQVSLDSAGSDPIPHILEGIPLRLRDIRVYIDRPGFTLNPTSCERFSVDSVLGGSGPRFANSADDSIARVSNPFQVASCAALGFRPRMTLRLKGGTKRGKYPSLTATVTPRRGDANFGRASVALPPSLFFAQEHMKTICTVPQFAADQCPAGSVYGRARAVTPLMDEPLEGPVYLRASSNLLPDLVADIRGRGVRVEVVGRIDSRKGGMRATYDVLPDAPVSRFALTLFGGKRGLLANSEDICKATRPATARMIAQNNSVALLRPRLLNPACKRKARAGQKRR